MISQYSMPSPSSDNFFGAAPDGLSSSAPSSSSNLVRRRSECEEPLCWICLGPGDLAQACKCPRSVHLRCMARWQLQQAGKTEEKICRFCHAELPDWKGSLTPANMQPADPVMVVTLGNEVHRVMVKPGPEGMLEFENKIRTLFNIASDVEFEVTFRCKAPLEDGIVPIDTIQLEGMNSYEAATHCASLMAAQRIASGGILAPLGFLSNANLCSTQLPICSSAS